MADTKGDVKYIVSMDASGYFKEWQKLDDSFDGLQKRGGDASISLSGLWKQVGIGTLAADAAKKAIGFLWGELKSTVTAAQDSETAHRNLEMALSTTGRSVDAILPKLSDYASALMDQTKYDDDAVKGAMSLMVQLTSLNTEGIEKATEGAIGLASTFNMDLQSAATLVAKAMAGSTAALGRYGIKVADNLPLQEKQNQLMEKLAPFYERAKGEVDTFGGALAQLRNSWGEVKEQVGTAITQNETVKRLFKDLTDWCMNSGPEIQEFVDLIAGAFSALLTGIRAVVDLKNEVREMISGHTGEVNAQTKAWSDLNKELGGWSTFMETAARMVVKDQKTWAGYGDEVNRLRDIWNKYGQDSVLALQAISRGDEGAKLQKVLTALSGVHGELATAADKSNAKINETGNVVPPVTEKIKTLKEQLSLTFTADNQERIKKLNQALVEYRGKMTWEQVEKIRQEIDSLSRSMKINLAPAAEDIEKFTDKGLTKLEGLAKKAIGEVGVAGEDIGAQVFSEIDAIVAKWDDVPKGAKEACGKTSNAFDGLYNDIARGMGDTMGDFFGEIAKGLDFAHGKFFEGGIKFKKLFENIFGDIKDIAFRKLGEIAANEILDKITGLFKKAGDAGKDTMEGVAKDAVKGAGDIVKGASGAISGLWTGLGAAVGTFLGTLLGGGGGLGKKEGGWIHETRDRAYDIMHTLDNMFANHEDIRANYWPSMTGTLEGIKLSADNGFGAVTGWLSGIETNTRSLRDLQSAQKGANFYATKPGLLAYHGGERVIVKHEREVIRETGGGGGAVNLFLDGKRIAASLKRRGQLGTFWLPAKAVR